MKMRTRTDSREIQLLRRIALVLGGITLILLVILSLQIHQWNSLHSNTDKVRNGEAVASGSDMTDTSPLTEEVTIPPAHAGEIRSDPLPDTIQDALPETIPVTMPMTTQDTLPETVLNDATDTRHDPIFETETAREGVWQEAQQVLDGSHFEPDPLGGYTLVSAGRRSDRILIVPSLTSDGEPVTGIGPGAFSDCTALAVIILPATLQHIDATAFSGCTQLVNITVEADCAAYCTSGGLLYDRDRTRLLCCPAALEAEQLLLPGSLLYIEDYALYGVRSVRSIGYEGSSEDWALIDIGRGNNILSILGVMCQGG